MAGAFSFEDVVAACLYVLCIWVAGKLFAMTGGTPLVGEIVAGMILGPYMLNLLGDFSGAFMLAGEIGLLLLVLEAGVEVDLTMLKMVGPLGVAVAIFGSICPMAIGYGLSYAYGYGTRACLSCAAAFAPTSMGIAINVLKSGKVLDTPTGQLIIAAAVVDDVIALVLLSELRALNDPTILNFVMPIAAAVISLVVGMLLAVFVFPRFMPPLIANFPEGQRGNIVLGMCLVLALVFMIVCYLARASYLLGAFLAGLCFCTVHEMEHAWVKQVKRIMYFLLHIFFSATIGFEIPITELWTGQTIMRTAGYMLCLLGKIATGVFARPLNAPEFLTIGWAMAAWGEFAFLVANESFREGILTKDEFMPLAFAILLSAVISPFALKFTLEWKNKRQRAALQKHTERVYRHRESIANASLAGQLADAVEGVAVYYKVVLRARSEWNIIPGLYSAAQDCDTSILDSRIHVKDGVFLHVFFLVDNQFELPLLCKKDSVEASTLQGRVREIHDAMAGVMTTRNDIVVLTVARWHPHLLGHPDDLDQAILEEMREDFARDLESSLSMEFLAKRTSVIQKDGVDDDNPNLVVEGYTCRGSGPVQALLYDNRQLEEVFRADAEDVRRGRRLSHIADISPQQQSTVDLDH